MKINNYKKWVAISLSVEMLMGNSGFIKSVDAAEMTGKNLR